MTHDFLSQIIKSAATMTEFCGRMTIQPADVAKAKELFAANHEDEDEDWAEEPADEDETMDDEEEKDDDALIYDVSDNEEERYIDEDKYPQNNAYTPLFDAAYPPVGEIVHLTDEQFSEKILVPLIEDVTKCALPYADGVDGMIKRAVYAFVVATLSESNE